MLTLTHYLGTVVKTIHTQDILMTSVDWGVASLLLYHSVAVKHIPLTYIFSLSSGTSLPHCFPYLATCCVLTGRNPSPSPPPHFTTTLSMQVNGLVISYMYQAQNLCLGIFM